MSPGALYVFVFVLALSSLGPLVLVAPRSGWRWRGCLWGWERERGKCDDVWSRCCGRRREQKRVVGGAVPASSASFFGSFFYSGSGKNTEVAGDDSGDTSRGGGAAGGGGDSGGGRDSGSLARSTSMQLQRGAERGADLVRKALVLDSVCDFFFACFPLVVFAEQYAKIYYGAEGAQATASFFGPHRVPESVAMGPRILKAWLMYGNTKDAMMGSANLMEVNLKLASTMVPLFFSSWRLFDAMEVRLRQRMTSLTPMPNQTTRNSFSFFTRQTLKMKKRRPVRIPLSIGVATAVVFVGICVFAAVRIGSVAQGCYSPAWKGQCLIPAHPIFDTRIEGGNGGGGGGGGGGGRGGGGGGGGDTGGQGCPCHSLVGRVVPETTAVVSSPAAASSNLHTHRHYCGSHETVSTWWQSLGGPQGDYLQVGERHLQLVI